MHRFWFSSILLVLLVSVAAQANEVCDAVNKIVTSGLDPKRPFAAVAAFQLPNADCETNIDGKYYSCGWVSENYDTMKELREEQDRLRMEWVRARDDWTGTFSFKRPAG